jgi:hypothetical protein
MEWLDNAIEWWTGHWRSIVYSFLAGAFLAAAMF